MRRPIPRALALFGFVLLLALLTANGCDGPSEPPRDPPPAGNRSPTVDAGADQDVAMGTTVTLAGVATDEDGDDLAFQWDIVGKPPSSTLALSASSSPTIRIHLDVVGAYVLELTVSDGEAEGSDRVTVTATDPRAGPGDNEAPELSSVDDQHVIQGETHELPFTVHDEEPASVAVTASSDDGTLIANEDLLVLGGGSARTLRLRSDIQGQGAATVTLTAVDAHGLEGRASFEVRVRAPYATEEAKIVLPTPEAPAERDSYSLTMKADGGRIILGSRHFNFGDSVQLVSSAHIFERRTDEAGHALWVQEAEFTSVSDTLDNFGDAVGIRGDWAAVGAYREATNGAGLGVVNLYHRTADGWRQTQKLTGGEGSRFFGKNVLVGKQSILVSSGDDIYINHVFVPNERIIRPTDPRWVEAEELSAPSGVHPFFFGGSTDLYEDTIVVGAPDPDQGYDSVVAFYRVDGQWSEPFVISSPRPESACFGCAVAVEGDWLVVGARADDEKAEDAGAAYVFRRSGQAWIESMKLTEPDSGPNHRFGSSVAMEGEYLLVGAPQAGIAMSGAAYLFRLIRGEWQPVGKFAHPNPRSNTRFGAEVSLTSTMAVITAPGEGHKGAVYVFGK